jgi:hypothetical protein
MFRRVTSLVVLLSLLTVALSAAWLRGPEVVCRMTGLPMAPPAEGGSCGMVTAAPAGLAMRFVLAKPGCCVLRYAARAVSPLAARTDVRAVPVAAVLAAIADAGYVPTIVPAVLPAAAARQDIPRGPPPQPGAPRAPPLFS